MQRPQGLLEPGLPLEQRRDQWRCRRAGTDRDNPDAEWGEFHRQHLREGDDAALRGAVRRIARECRVQSRNRGDVDDHATAWGLDQMWDGVLAGVERAAQVDANHVLPLFVWRLARW